MKVRAGPHVQVVKDQTCWKEIQCAGAPSPLFLPYLNFTIAHRIAKYVNYKRIMPCLFKLLLQETPRELCD